MGACHHSLPMFMGGGGQHRFDNVNDVHAMPKAAC